MTAPPNFSGTAIGTAVPRMYHPNVAFLTPAELTSTFAVPYSFAGSGVTDRLQSAEKRIVNSGSFCCFRYLVFLRTSSSP